MVLGVRPFKQQVLIWSHLRIGRALAVPLGHPAHPLLDLLETCEKPYDLRVFVAITGGKEQKNARLQDV